jgi:hypothetical protein
MSYRRSLLGLVIAATFVLNACSGTGASAVPSVAIPSIPASIGTGDLTGFCEDIASPVASAWPNVDQSTATELSSVVQEWSTNSALESIRGDVGTIATWLTTAAQSGAVASPPADVQTAFQNIRTFADANC